MNEENNLANLSDPPQASSLKRALGLQRQYIAYATNDQAINLGPARDTHWCCSLSR